MTEKSENIQNNFEAAVEPHNDLRTLIENAPYNGSKAVTTLRKAGYRVVLRHLRRSVPATPDMEPLPLVTKAHIPFDYEILPTGGQTQVDITDPFGERVTGGAVCSDKDNFWCEGGRYLALERAFEKLRKNERSAKLLKKILKNAK